LVSEDSQDRRRHRKRKDRDYDKEKRKGPRQVKRDEKTREPKGSVVAMTQGEQPQAAMLNAPWPGGPIDASQGGGGGITIPQHIIIPPSSGTYGPDGRLQPQSYQINSEIRICYDQHGRPVPHSGVPATGTMPVGLSSVPPQIQSAGMPLMAPSQFPTSGGAQAQLRPQVCQLARSSSRKSVRWLA
uniref:Nuclear receptor coactivator 6 n=1 Tax=Anisakis simplex TaxID=6269 RepID=A0A0M3JAX5_ANISI